MIESTTVIPKNIDFIVNNLPSAFLIAGFAIESGIPPPNMP